MDEPFFLAIARQILKDPLHPLAFDFNWYGASRPMAQMNNTPPVLPYLMAAALKLTGGGEFSTRALFLPFDLASAWGLLALAGRFLRRPLLPVLCVILGPAWVVNMPHLMAERVMAGFAFPALWLALVAAEEKEERAFWGSAALAAGALLSKYNALFLVPPALVALRRGGASWARLAAWCAVAFSGVAGWQAWNALSGVGTLGAAWAVTADSSRGFWSAPTHKARSLFAFLGGCAPAIALWGLVLRPRREVWVPAALLAAVLFGPWCDLAPVVRGIDRATGLLLALGVAVSVRGLARGERSRGLPFWAAWAAAGAALQLAYWSVMARFVAFLLPAFVFALAERLEASWDDARVAGLARATLAVTLALGAGVAAVDWRYAWAQREFARRVAAEEVAPGRKVWCLAHWGLQEYLTAAGGEELDMDKGGWEAVRPGDRVVVTRVNSNRFAPRRPIHADATTTTVDFPLPLRHISGWSGEGGFYSSMMGFLPWSLSTEPVEEFTLVRAL